MKKHKIIIHATYRYKEHKATLYVKSKFLCWTFWKEVHSFTGKYATVCSVIHRWMTEYNLTEDDVQDDHDTPYEPIM